MVVLITGTISPTLPQSADNGAGDRIGNMVRPGGTVTAHADAVNDDGFRTWLPLVIGIRGEIIPGLRVLFERVGAVCIKVAEQQVGLPPGNGARILLGRRIIQPFERLWFRTVRQRSATRHQDGHGQHCH